MFGPSLKLFTLSGFDVKVDVSWIVIAVLVVWSLAAGLFPVWIEGLQPAVYWYMGIAGAIGLFGSIILHEFGHSIVARKYGIPIRGITLFIFGGVAEMEKEPPTAKSEFLMAIAGPVMSLFLVVVFSALYMAAAAAEVAMSIVAVLAYLAWINAIVVVFNMIPAFPLDGGRVLRSLLWAWKKRLRWATRVASTIGSGFGFVLIGFGIS
jgi:Zn-dependent protease